MANVRTTVTMMAALASATVSGQAPALPAQERPLFRAHADLIEVDVLVTDGNGRPVNGLGRDDFEILEDGAAQTVVNVSFVDHNLESPIEPIRGRASPDTATNARTGRTWVLLVGGGGEVARRVLRQFVEHSLGAVDEVAIIQVLGTMSQAQGFTRNRQTMLAAIERIADVPPAIPDDPVRTAYEVLEDLCVRLGALGGRRKNVIFFDPPGFFAPEGSGDPRDVGRLFFQRDAIRAATRNNVAVHVVSTAGLSTELGTPLWFPDRRDPLKAMAGQRLLAEETGGDAVVNSNDFGQGLERVVRENSAYYILGYTPSVEHRDGRFHPITVRVRRPGLSVRARRGYYAPDPASAPATSPSVPEPLLEVREALRMPLSVSGITIELFASPFRGAQGNSDVLLGAQVRGEDLALDGRAAIVVAYQAMNTEGKVSAGAFKQLGLDLSDASRVNAASAGVRITERIALPPGRHQVRFAVHQQGGKTGLVVTDVDVPAFDKEPVSMSGLVLASERLGTTFGISDDEAISAAIGSPPTARRQFARADVLTAFAEVYTSGRTQIRDLVVRAAISPEGSPKAGRDVETRVVSEGPGRVARTARIVLSNLAPGNYVLSLEARAGRRTVARSIPIQIDGE